MSATRDSNDEKRRARAESYWRDTPPAPSITGLVSGIFSSIWQQLKGTQAPKWGDAASKQITADAEPIPPQGPGTW